MDALGMIEARGMIAIVAGLDTMCKNTQVECVFIERVSGGYVVAGIRGDIAHVQEALRIGAAAVQQHGELRRAQVYTALNHEARALVRQLQSPAAIAAKSQ